MKGIIIIRICTVKPALSLPRFNKSLSSIFASLNFAISICNFHVCRKISLRIADVFPVVASLTSDIFGGREATIRNTSAVHRLQNDGTG